MVPFIYEQPKLTYFQMGPICAEQKHYFDAQIWKIITIMLYMKLYLLKI